MAGVIPFGYRSGRTPLHGLDVRVKLISLILVSLTSFRMGPGGLSVLSAGLFLLSISTAVSMRTLFKEFRYLSILLILIVAARGLTLNPFPAAGEKMVSVSLEGLAEGTVVCWRLLLVVAAGVVFISTTRSSQIKAAVEWVFSPFRIVPGRRVAVMVALLLRFLPLILKQAKETADAQRARGIESRRNPVYRMKKLVVPLLRRTLGDADRLALAMAARCYSEKRTDPLLYATRQDLSVLVAVGVFCMLLLLL